MQTHTHVASRSDLDALLDLNRDYIRSVQTSDVRRFSEILADDFLCSNPDGSLIDRDAFLSQTARPVVISNLEAHDVNVRIMGDFAIIHARTTYTRPDGGVGSGRYTDVWARRQGGAMVLAAIGVALMLGGGLALGQLAGNALALGSAVAFAAHALLLRSNRRSDMLPAVLYAGLFGCRRRSASSGTAATATRTSSGTSCPGCASGGSGRPTSGC